MERESGRDFSLVVGVALTSAVLVTALLAISGFAVKAAEFPDHPPAVGDWSSHAHAASPRGILAQDLPIDVNYGDDWIEGAYEVGHTVWITVTESDGSTVKATSQLETWLPPWWNGVSGFTTQIEGAWSPSQPDILPGDWVYGRVDDGYATEVRVGEISGTLDYDTDVISGTVTAPWLMGLVDVECAVWEDGGTSVSVDEDVDPNGGVYVCTFSGEWDLQQGDLVAVSYAEPDFDQVFMTFHEIPPTLGIRKTGAGQPTGTGNYEFTIEYWNEGDFPAESTVITDTLLGGMSYIADTLGLPYSGGGSQVVFDLGTVEPRLGGDFRLFAEVTAPVAQIITNTARINTSSPFAAPPGEAEWAMPVVENDTHLDVRTEVRPADPAPGGELFWDVRVCNWGTTSSATAVLTHTAPAEVPIQFWWADDPGWVESSGDPQTVVVARPTISGQRCSTVHLNSYVDPSVFPGQLLCGSSLITSINDLEPEDNESVLCVEVGQPHANLAVEKRLHAGVPAPGGWLDYELSYFNTGNQPVLQPVFLTDTLPVGSSFDSAWIGDGWAFDPATITVDHVVWEIPEVAIGETQSFFLRVNIDPDVSVGAVLTNTVDITRLPDEDSWQDNTNTVVTQANDPGPNLAVTKRHEWWGGAYDRDRLSYTLRFMNLGTGPVSGVVVTDTLPVDTGWNGWWYSEFPGVAPMVEDPGLLVWEISQLAPGDVGEIEFVANLNQPGVTGQWFTNTVEIEIPAGDTNPADNAFEEVTVIREVWEVHVGMRIDSGDLWGFSPLVMPTGWVTVTTPSGQFSTQPTPPDGWWGFDDVGPILAGDMITVTAGAGNLPVVIQVPDPFTATADSDTDLVWGQIDHLDHEPVHVVYYSLPENPVIDVETDANGHFEAMFPDLLPGAVGEVYYPTEIGHAMVGFHREFLDSPAHLRVWKSGEGVPAEGGNYGFRVGFANDGVAQAESVVITDTLMPGMSYLSDTSGLSVITATLPVGEQVVFDLGTVDPAVIAEFDVFVRITASQSEIITNTAEIATPSPNSSGPWERFAEWTGVVQPNDTDLSVSKTPDVTEPDPDTDLVWDLIVCNIRSTSSTEVVITDTLPPATTFLDWWADEPGWAEISSGPSTLIVARPTVAGDHCSTLHIRSHVVPDASPGLELCNIAEVSSDNDVDPANNLTTACVVVAGGQPAITIQKLTNGVDADDPPGPYISVGEPVEWTYTVTNTGNVTLTGITVVDDQPGVAPTCPGDVLGPQETMECGASGVAVEGQYANLGVATGHPPVGDPVMAEDPSHYFGTTPGITIQKLTNGVDADDPPGPYISVGEPVEWTYTVTNTGNITLTGITVVDDQPGVAPSCPGDVLAPQETMECGASGVAVEGQYANLGVATGHPPVGDPVMAEDPSHYFGTTPGITIQKLTNGVDADDPPGPYISVGEPVEWTYTVTNTGNVMLTGVTVVDDQPGVTPDCAPFDLQPDETVVCTASGVAVEGQYGNLGVATGHPPVGDPVMAEDPSHYFGMFAGLDIEKATNGVDADDPPGPEIEVGFPVEWTYTVRNTGNVPLIGVTVEDDQPEVEPDCLPFDLGPDEEVVCTAAGVAVEGQYENLGTVTGTPPVGPPVADSDPSHYLGFYGLPFADGFESGDTSAWSRTVP